MIIDINSKIQNWGCNSDFTALSIMTAAAISITDLILNHDLHRHV